MRAWHVTASCSVSVAFLGSSRVAGKLTPLYPVSVCEGRCGACYPTWGTLLCSISASLWCSPPGPVLGCGLSRVEALLPVLAASPHHFTGSWPRETGWSCSVCTWLCKSVTCSSFKGHLFHHLHEETGHNSCLPGAVFIPAQLLLGRCGLRGRCPEAWHHSFCD